MTTQMIWQQFNDELDAFIRSRVANPDDAEDMRQQVYLQIHRHLKDNAAPSHLRGWVYQIARNVITDYYRRSAVRQHKSTHDPDAAAAEQPTDSPSATEEATQSLARCLLNMVDRLPSPYAQALRWTELEGVSQQAAADRAGVSLPGMKSRVQRGRAKLHEALLACCEVELDARKQPIRHHCRGACGCG